MDLVSRATLKRIPKLVMCWCRGLGFERFTCRDSSDKEVLEHAAQIFKQS